MCGDFGFYASEIIHAIRGLKEQGTLETFIDVFGAVGPVFMTGIAIWISNRGSKNMEAIQKQIATAEERSLKRKVLLETYSLFLNHEIHFLLREGFLKVPGENYANGLCRQIENRHQKMYEAYNKTKMIVVKNSSNSANDLLKAIKNALDIYSDFSEKAMAFVGNNECQEKYETAIMKLKQEYGDCLENDIFKDQEKRTKFLKYTDCDAIKKIEEVYARYLNALRDENFDVYFQKYLNTLSK